MPYILSSHSSTQNIETYITRFFGGVMPCVNFSELQKPSPHRLPFPVNLNPPYIKLQPPLRSSNLLLHSPSPTPSPLHPHSSKPFCLFLLNAPGGTGKTFFTNAIPGFLARQSKSVIAVVTSEVAAQLFSGGRAANLQNTRSVRWIRHLQYPIRRSDGHCP